MTNNSLSFIPSLQSPLKNTQKMPDAHSKSIRHSPRKYKQPNYNSIKANLHHKSSAQQTVYLMYRFLQTRKHLYIKLITFFSIGIQSDFFDRFLNKAQIHNINSLSAFRRAFISETGMTPGQFRRELQGEGQPPWDIRNNEISPEGSQTLRAYSI